MTSPKISTRRDFATRKYYNSNIIDVISFFLILLFTCAIGIKNSLSACTVQLKLLLKMMPFKYVKKTYHTMQ